MSENSISPLKRMQRERVINYRFLNKNVKKSQILFTGSSLMEGFPITELCADAGLPLIAYNRGISGYRTEDFLAEINTVLLDLQPSKIFINIGTNDICEYDDGRDWLQHLLKNYGEILKIGKAALKQTQFYLMAYYPVNASAASRETKETILKVRTNKNIAVANLHIEKLAEQYGCSYIDVNDGLCNENGDLKAEFTIDGVHMYANGYQVVFENLKKYLFDDERNAEDN